MILDSLNNTTRFEVLNPLFKKAFDYVKTTDLTTVEDGKYEIEGKDLFISVVTICGKLKEDAKMETHNEYIDIQMPLQGVESIGWKAGSELKEAIGEYNPEKDITFFVDKPTTYDKIYPGQFAIYFPEDGHAPGIGEGTIRKAIVKVRVK
ncbi:MAG: YhcH/YjgK/YiaL family protein [Tannerellaceae bacterium]|nr:YhcH/YjgK/YiaL family protein [Tannerellaceae bacterium]MCD8264364.1 YhcH/YjgK/YiaL family protein [Tannerellaceae bacterium]